MECQVNVKSQSELDIGGRETCWGFFGLWALDWDLASGLSTDNLLALGPSHFADCTGRHSTDTFVVMFGHHCSSEEDST